MSVSGFLTILLEVRLSPCAYATLPARTSHLLTDSTQCFAVTTQVGEMSVPPQKSQPLSPTLARPTCHFHTQASALVPFTMVMPGSLRRFAIRAPSTTMLAASTDMA